MPVISQSFINAGGRVFASHGHNIWISNAPSPLNTVAAFVSDGENDYEKDTSDHALFEAADAKALAAGRSEVAIIEATKKH